MPPPNLPALRAVADRLDRLGLDYAFVGGSIVNLLLDHPNLSPARPTDDFDVIIETVTARPYSDVVPRPRQCLRCRPEVESVDPKHSGPTPSVLSLSPKLSSSLPRSSGWF